MPVYDIVNPTTGQKLTLTGDGVPSDADIREAFNSVKPSAKAAMSRADMQKQFASRQGTPATATKYGVNSGTPDDGVPQWGRDHPNLYGIYGAAKGIGSAAVEGTGAALGTAAGTAAGALTPIPGGALMGGMAGGGAGYAGAKRLSQTIGLSDEPVDNSASGIGKDVAIGAAMGAIPAAASVVGKGVRMLPGGDTAMNLLTKAPVGKGMLDAARVPDVAKTAAAIDTSFTKAIRPSAKGMRPFKDTAEYNANAQNAVKEIVMNKDNLGITNSEGEAVAHLPKTLPQMEQAINSTKRGIWEKVKTINDSAADAQVPLDSAVNELESISRTPVVKTMSPETAAYAKTKAGLLRTQKSFSVDEAQDAITRANRSAEHYYASPSADTESRAYIDSLVANHLRDGLDTTLESVTGTPAAAPLRRAYGSLKAIEQDVRQRALVDARKNTKGLVDFSDIYTAGELAASMVTGNPVGAARGLTMAAMKARVKWWNDPNTHVERVFKLADKLVSKADFPLPEVAPVAPTPIQQPPWAGAVNTGGLTQPGPQINRMGPVNTGGIVQPTSRQQLMQGIGSLNPGAPARSQLATSNLLGTVKPPNPLVRGIKQ